DKVLEATQLRLVLFLEDLDRNTETAILRSEVGALLDRLKDLQNVSFVLAVEPSSNNDEIVLKVCEHVEVVPQIDFFASAVILESFRRHCHARYPEDIPVDAWDEKGERFGFNVLDARTHPVVGEHWPTTSDPVDALAELLQPVRRLKRVLRRMTS